MKNWGFSLLLIFAALLTACGGEEANTNSDVTPSIGIVTQDSVYLLTLNNFQIDKSKANKWTLDGEAITLTKVTETQFSIASSKIKAGKHKITLLQGDQTVSGDIYKIITLGYKVKKTIPHRGDLFTEGFFFDDAHNLWESSGLDGKSKIFKMHWSGAKWQILDSINEQTEEFGEGISILNGELVHLYWKNQYLKTFSLNPLKNTKAIPFEGEGWGLCTAGKDALWVSNGSSQLRKMHINNGQLLTLKTINVNNDIGPVANLNELEEWQDRYIWANIWQSDHIVLIDQNNGDVVADLNLSNLGMQERNGSFNAEVLNGIAWNKEDNTLWVTGKYWKNIYILDVSSLPNP